MNPQPLMFATHSVYVYTSAEHCMMLCWFFWAHVFWAVVSTLRRSSWMNFRNVALDTMHCWPALGALQRMQHQSQVAFLLDQLWLTLGRQWQAVGCQRGTLSWGCLHAHNILKLKIRLWLANNLNENAANCKNTKQESKFCKCLIENYATAATWKTQSLLRLRFLQGENNKLRWDKVICEQMTVVFNCRQSGAYDPSTESMNWWQVYNCQGAPPHTHTFSICLSSFPGSLGPSGRKRKKDDWWLLSFLAWQVILSFFPNVL